jgi:hypothetical protein
VGSKSILASLTIGGFDSSRLHKGTLRQGDRTSTLSPDDTVLPNNLSFSLRSYMRESKDRMNTFQRTWLENFNIDTSRVDSMLPEEFCVGFDSFLGLKRDNATQFLLVDADNHRRLWQRNPALFLEVSLGRTNDYYKDPVIFHFSYRELALNISGPLFPSNSMYIPIRCGAAGQPLTLGRAFMQKAYIIVTEGKWYIGRAMINPTAKPNIVPVKSNTFVENWETYGGSSSGSYNSEMKSSHALWLTGNAIVGIALASIFVFAAACLGMACWARKRHRDRTNAEMAKVIAALQTPPPYQMNDIELAHWESLPPNHITPLPPYRPRSLPPYSAKQ